MFFPALVCNPSVQPGLKASFTTAARTLAKKNAALSPKPLHVGIPLTCVFARSEDAALYTPWSMRSERPFTQRRSPMKSTWAARSSSAGSSLIHTTAVRMSTSGMPCPANSRSR